MVRQQSTVTIVTPSLNSASFLPRLLACIRGQTYPHVEHIIVDGGSTDGTAKILKTIDRSKHRVLIKKDRSMYQAINRGIKVSHGDIIGYLNADDLYFPSTIATIVDYFARHPRVDIVFGDVVSVNEQTKSFVLYVYAQHQYTLSRIALNKSIGQPSVFFRRRVIDAIGLFDDSLRFIADLEYWMKAAKHQRRFQKINKFLSMDVRRSGMLRDRYEHSLNKELAKVKRRYFRYADWQKRLFERRNYWEDIFLDKFLEYNAGSRFLTDPTSQIIFDQRAYRLARKHRLKSKQPILSIKLPYFTFEGIKLDGI